MSRLLRGARRCTNEKDLQCLLLNSPPPPYTYFVAQEWPVASPFTNLGVGDLVFKRPKVYEYLVVEVKHLGKGNRKKGRKKVVEQAHFYGLKWKERQPRASVKFATFTNESGLKILGDIEVGNGVNCNRRG